MEKTNKIYIVAVDMGYGHQRAAHPLIDIATTPREWNLDKPIIISANNYPGMPKSDKAIWDNSQKAYEAVSRFRDFPILGKMIFGVLDYMQQIPPFYPKRDLSKPNFQEKEIYALIKKGFGKHLIETLNKDPLTLFCTFFNVAFFAEEHGYKGEIYCLCTDSDVFRGWAPLNPQISRINYLAPTKRVAERLKQYGIKEEKIITTGFPLPKETLGDEEKLDVLKQNLSRRIQVLDPNNIYRKKYKDLISLYLGQEINTEVKKPLTLTFAVGGAGAQKEIGIEIIKSLKDKIKNEEIKINLIAGISKPIAELYGNTIKELGLEANYYSGIQVIYNEDKFEYFNEFNKIINETDILWTKPSELSFYSGLGLPIIMSQPLGAQEDSNRAWLQMLGAGVDAGDAKYTNEWLMDLVNSGWLANAAMNGFMNAPKKGTYHINDLLLNGKKTEIENIHFI